MKRFSLTKRVVFLSSAWTIIALLLLGWLLFEQYRAGAEKNFLNLQDAQLYSLIGAVGLDEAGNLTGTPNLGDENFLISNTGWFWRVTLLGNKALSIASPSIADIEIKRPTTDEVPYDEQFVRTYTILGPFGDYIRVHEGEIDVGGGTIALFQVGANESEFEAEIRNFTLNTLFLLGIFGAGMVLINVVIILFGLKPLDKVRRSLLEIRSGRANALEGEFPTEIEPMVSEMNVLIENNRQTVERARTQVGNLAHSLKTPIAVLTNEADAHKAVDAKIILAQTQMMQSQVQHYLGRARIAAQAGSLAFRTDAGDATTRLVRVMQKLNPDKIIEYKSAETLPMFAGEKEDFEEILGNLLENACKWGRSKISVSLNGDEAASDGRAWLKLVIEDDGPGIASDGYDLALKRGQRLDESVPGTGLGLSIVADTAKAYGGDIELGKSALGGLSVVIKLPAIRTKS